MVCRVNIATILSSNIVSSERIHTVHMIYFLESTSELPGVFLIKHGKNVMTVQTNGSNTLPNAKYPVPSNHIEFVFLLPPIRFAQYKSFSKMTADIRMIEKNVVKTITRQIYRKYFVFV